MSKGNADIIAKKIKELPPLPLVVHSLLNVVSDQNVSAKKVADILSTDQAMTSKVLRLVNSSFYGLPGEVSTISRAVVILGNAAVRNIALAFGAIEVLKKVGDGDIQQKFWSHALACATAAKALAPKLKYSEAEEAFIAGLLHDIGHLILSTVFRAEYLAVYSRIGPDFLEREEELIGVTHPEVGTRLLEQWQIPEHLCRVVRQHHNVSLANPEKEPLISLVMLADILASIKDCHIGELPNPVVLTKITRESGLSFGIYGPILPLITEKISEATISLGLKDISKFSSDGPSGDNPLSVLLIGDNEDRILWVKGLFESFGNQVMISEMSEASKQVLDETHLAIFDPEGISNEHISQLRTFLTDRNIPHAALAGSKRYAQQDDNNVDTCPVLPFIFSREHIRRLLKEVPERCR